jgi:excisionase family DNA binding protein
MKRRIEIQAFERERIIRRTVAMQCPVCEHESEMLTAKQAAVLLQVSTKSIYRWLAEGKAHGVRTPGGCHRVCRESLFVPWAARARAEVIELIPARLG